MSANMTTKELRDFMRTRVAGFIPTYRDGGHRRWKSYPKLVEELERSKHASATRIQALVRGMQARRRFARKKLTMRLDLPHNVALKIARQI